MTLPIRFVGAAVLLAATLSDGALAADPARATRALTIEPDVEQRSRIVEVMVHVPTAGRTAAELSEQGMQMAIDAALALAGEQAPEVASQDLVVQALDYREFPVSNGKLPITLTAEVKYPAKAAAPVQIVVDQTSGEVVSGPLFTPVQLAAEAPLEVRVWTQSQTFVEGEEMVIRIRGNHDFYGRLVYRDVEGNVLQILPNAYRADAVFKADTDYVVPGPGDKFRLRVSAPFGDESVTLMASTRPLGDISTKEASNGLLIADGGLDQIATKTRALKLEPVDVAVSAQSAGAVSAQSMGSVPGQAVTAVPAQAAKAASGADFIEQSWKVTTRGR